MQCTDSIVDAIFGDDARDADLAGADDLDVDVGLGERAEHGGGGVLPRGPSLHSVKGWTAEGFAATMRTGKTPFGRQLDSLQMPWKVYGRLTDDELTAVHKYLASLD